jgi:hypothetical protein
MNPPCGRCGQTVQTARNPRNTHNSWIMSEREDGLGDYERLAETSEAFFYAAMSRLMVRRLARA